jgi:branched-chain amino acid aminotransferase
VDNIFLNGAFLSRAEAHIALEDRGFRFGDGIFTTLAIIEKIPLFWELHEERLRIGNALLQLRHELAPLHAQLQKVIAMNHINDGIARIVISRGSGSAGYSPTYASPPTILIECMAQPPLLAIYYRTPHNPPAPLTLHISTWQRPPPSVLPNTTKLLQGLNPILAKMEAQAAGCDDALMLDTQGFVSEAASGNLFWLDNTGVLHTPPLTTGCLKGVMRTWLMQYFTVHETYITLPALLNQSAVFFCNATSGVRPVSHIGEQPLAQDHSWRMQCQKYLHQHIAEQIKH